MRIPPKNICSNYKYKYSICIEISKHKIEFRIYFCIFALYYLSILILRYDEILTEKKISYNLSGYNITTMSIILFCHMHNEHLNWFFVIKRICTFFAYNIFERCGLKYLHIGPLVYYLHLNAHWYFINVT